MKNEHNSNLNAQRAIEEVIEKLEAVMREMAQRVNATTDIKNAIRPLSAVVQLQSACDTLMNAYGELIDDNENEEPNKANSHE